MILRRLPAPAYPVRLADLTLWLRGVVQWRSGHVAASPDLRTMAPPTEPEFVDTEAGWHTA